MEQKDPKDGWSSLISSAVYFEYIVIDIQIVSDTLLFGNFDMSCKFAE
jgi:hypothetical protein